MAEVQKRNPISRVRKPLTLFEHEPFRARDVRLERLRATTKREILSSSFPAGAEGYRPSATSASLRRGRRDVQILPTIFRGHLNRDERVRQATGNLLHRLGVAEQIGVCEHGLASLLRRDVDWIEVLTRLFAMHLMEQRAQG